MDRITRHLTSLQQRRSSSRRRVGAYALAVLAVGMSAGVRWMLNPVLGDNGPYLLFVPAVMLASLVGGLGPGLVATVLASVLGEFLWVEPHFTFMAGSTDELVHACTSLVVGAAISILSHWMRRVSQAERESSAAKDRFIAVLGHELRQPLTTMAAAVETLRSQLAGREDAEETLEILRRNLSLHTLLINDLLDVNRIAAGKMHLQRRVCDLNKIVKAAADACYAQMQERRLTLKCRRPAEPCWVDADPARLQQVFWNLLRNATKFTPPGGEITVTVATQEEQVRVSVQDTGIGIAPEKLPILFQAFEQAHGELSTRLGGLGLGLAICQGIVRSHSGRIEVASDGPGRGATFTVVLQTAAPPATGTATDSPAPAKMRPGAPRRILLVEDQAETRQLLAKLLRRAGYEVMTAEGVQSAIAMIGADVDLLVSDMTLGDGTGVELLQRLGDRRPRKAICLSGLGSPEDVTRSRQAGFARHLTKPVELPQLQQTISELLRE